MLEVLIIGDQDAERKLDGLEEQLHREIYAALLESGIRLESASREEAPKRTSNLARSIDSDVRRFPNRWELSLGFGRGAPYAKWVHEGTGVFHKPDAHTPWTVRPRRPGGVLRFTWRGRVWYRRSVTIRGMRPNDFVHRALVRETPFIERRFREIGPRLKTWMAR